MATPIRSAANSNSREEAGAISNIEPDAREETGAVTDTSADGAVQVSVRGVESYELRPSGMRLVECAI